jgi:pilus assembly protein CpaE
MTSVVVAQSGDPQLGALIRDAGLTIAATLPIGDLQTLEKATARAADVLIVDIRGRGTIPMEVAALKRRYPKIGILLVAAQLDQAMMLEAMRSGVTEVITDPLSSVDLQNAVARLVGQFLPKQAGEVLGFIGAKGGVGTTTLAVNLATALAADKKSRVVLVDLHTTTYGDAALLLGIEPRFSVADALDNVSRMDEAYLKGLVTRTGDGVDVVAAPEQPSARPVDVARVKALLQRLTEMYRWIVLDVPSSDLGLIDGIEPMFAMSLVVNQELPAVRRAADLAKILRQKYGSQKIGLVVSRFDAGADIRPEDIQKAVGLPVWGLLPSDYKRVVAAANLGKPLVNDANNRVSGVIKQLANKFMTSPRPEADKTTTTASRSFNRIAGLF